MRAVLGMVVEAQVLGVKVRVTESGTLLVREEFCGLSIQT